MEPPIVHVWNQQPLPRSQSDANDLERELPVTWWLIILRQAPLYGVVSTSHGHMLLGWDLNREANGQYPAVGHVKGHTGCADRRLLQLYGRS